MAIQCAWRFATWPLKARDQWKRSEYWKLRGNKGVFQPVLEALLRDQKRWAKDGAPEQELIIQISTEAGLDPEAARTQMLEPIIAATINQDRADAEVLGVTQTPTFFVNGRSVNSFGEAELRALVNEEVAASRK